MIIETIREKLVEMDHLYFSEPIASDKKWDLIFRTVETLEQEYYPKNNLLGSSFWSKLLVRVLGFTSIFPKLPEKQDRPETTTNLLLSQSNRIDYTKEQSKQPHDYQDEVDLSALFFELNKSADTQNQTSSVHKAPSEISLNLPKLPLQPIRSSSSFWAVNAFNGNGNYNDIDGIEMGGIGPDGFYILNNYTPSPVIQAGILSRLYVAYLNSKVRIANIFNKLPKSIQTIIEFFALISMIFSFLGVLKLMLKWSLTPNFNRKAGENANFDLKNYNLTQIKENSNNLTEEEWQLLNANQCNLGTQRPIINIVFFSTNEGRLTPTTIEPIWKSIHQALSQFPWYEEVQLLFTINNQIIPYTPDSLDMINEMKRVCNEIFPNQEERSGIICALLSKKRWSLINGRGHLGSLGSRDAVLIAIEKITTITHELGHVLGSKHDDWLSAFTAKIMKPAASIILPCYYYSKNSIRDIQPVIEKYFKNCINKLLFGGQEGDISIVRGYASASIQIIGFPPMPPAEFGVFMYIPRNFDEDNNAIYTIQGSNHQNFTINPIDHIESVVKIPITGSLEIFKDGKLVFSELSSNQTLANNSTLNRLKPLNYSNPVKNPNQSNKRKTIALD